MKKLLLISFIAGILLVNINSIFAQNPIQRKGGTYFRISLQSYAFNKLLNDNVKGRGKGMSLYDLMDFCAENNFDAVDLTDYYFPGYPDKLPTDEFIYNVKRRAYELGLSISGTGVRNDFSNPDPVKRAADVKHVKEWVDVAVKMGAPVVRIFSGAKLPEGSENKWDSVANYMAADIKECVAYAKERGIMIAVQNHGDFLKTADETIKLVKLVNSDWFGIINDTGYFLTDDPYADIAKVMPYTVNFLLKESPIPLGSPVRIDLPRIIKILHDNNYRGFVNLETLSARTPSKDKTKTDGAKSGYDPYTAVPAFLKMVKTAAATEFGK